MAYLEFYSNCGEKNVFGSSEGRDRFHCTQCGAIHYENPNPAATLFCPKDDYILLVKRAFEPAKGEWCLPGGFMELNETIEMAAERELLEETALKGKVKEFLGHCSHYNTVFGDVLLIGFIVSIECFSNLTPGDDALEAELFHLDNLPPLAFPCHQKFLDMYLQKINHKPGGKDKQ